MSPIGSESIPPPESLEATPASPPTEKEPDNRKRPNPDAKNSQPPPKKKPKRNKFIYGNYSRYYGYRKQPNNNSDPRVDLFHQPEHKDLFRGKDILDIGCNTGFLTIQVAKRLYPKSIVGVDIDKNLIHSAIGSIRRELRSNLDCFALKNTRFETADYVLPDARLLKAEKQHFDLILCLSLTKWIHLNYGDDGIKLTFKRIFAQLRPGGRMILEPQSWKSYAKRKCLSEQILKNYRSIRLMPERFEEYLIKEVGFVRAYSIRKVDEEKGFNRPMIVFVKGE